MNESEAELAEYQEQIEADNERTLDAIAEQEVDQYGRAAEWEPIEGYPDAKGKTTVVHDDELDAGDEKLGGLGVDEILLDLAGRKLREVDEILTGVTTPTRPAEAQATALQSIAASLLVLARKAVL